MNILLIEDNKGDQRIMQEAFHEAKVECHLDMASDGVEAMDILKREGTYSDAVRPDLIVLDLNMPRKNGKEVLAELKNDPRFHHIPVIIFSNSISPKDICECYTLNANVYAAKPFGFEGFVDFARTVKEFWMKQVRYCPHA